MNQKAVPVLVVLLITASFLLGIQFMQIKNLETKPKTPSSPSSPPIPSPSKILNQGEIKINPDDPVLGSEKATLSVVEFADYQCPYCGAASGKNSQMVSSMKQRDSAWEPLFPGLEEYLAKGEVYFVYKDMAFLGQESNWAAEAARCAGDEKKYWEYHDLLYSQQKGENQGTFSKENLKKFARQLKLNGNDFDQCLDSGKYSRKVQETNSYAQSISVNSTPTVFVNGKKIQGGFKEVKTAIDEELKK